MGFYILVSFAWVYFHGHDTCKLTWNMSLIVSIQMTTHFFLIPHRYRTTGIGKQLSVPGSSWDLPSDPVQLQHSISLRHQSHLSTSHTLSPSEHLHRSTSSSRVKPKILCIIVRLLDFSSNQIGGQLILIAKILHLSNVPSQGLQFLGRHSAPNSLQVWQRMNHPGRLEELSSLSPNLNVVFVYFV